MGSLPRGTARRASATAQATRCGSAPTVRSTRPAVRAPSAMVAGPVAATDTGTSAGANGAIHAMRALAPCHRRHVVAAQERPDVTDGALELRRRRGPYARAGGPRSRRGQGRAPPGRRTRSARRRRCTPQVTTCADPLVSPVFGDFRGLPSGDPDGGRRPLPSDGVGRAASAAAHVPGTPQVAVGEHEPRRIPGTLGLPTTARHPAERRTRATRLGGWAAYRFAWPRARASVSSSAGTSSRGTTAWMMLSRSA